MKCKKCGKDITSLYFFTRKEYCSEQCEKKKRPPDPDLPPGWGSVFGQKF